jgi:hypothetical protein
MPGGGTFKEKTYQAKVNNIPPAPHQLPSFDSMQLFNISISKTAHASYKGHTDIFTSVLKIFIGHKSFELPNNYKSNVLSCWHIHIFFIDLTFSIHRSSMFTEPQHITYCNEIIKTKAQVQILLQHFKMTCFR